jgi:glycosyltransferase 2 family protein
MIVQGQSAVRKWAAVAVRVGLTGALFAVIVANTDLGAALARLGRVQPFGPAVAVLLALFQVALNAGRWGVLMRLSSGTMAYRQALQMYLESMFFYQALPLGVLGGDGVRVYRTVRLGSSLRQAVNSVLLDRVAGLLGLVVLIVVFQPLFYCIVEDVAARAVFAALIAAGIVGTAALVGLRWLPVWWRRHRLVGALVGLADLAGRMLREPSYLAPTLGLTVAGHSASIVAVWFLAKSLSLPISLLDCFVMMPAAILVSMIPISVAGWGTRESAVVATLALIDVAADQALSLSVLFGLVWLGVGLIGGLVWLMQSMFGYEPIRRVSGATRL